MTYRRDAQNDLTRWYDSKNRRPLIIRGARQVGKSTLVRLFAAERQLDLFEVNLEDHIELDATFNTLKVDPILNAISSICQRDIGSSQHPLIFLDEIQATPHALRWLRYVYEKRPDLAVVTAGSLLEFAIRDADYSMPVGRVDHMWLRPMSFREYLTARDEDYLRKQIDTLELESLDAMPGPTHKALLARQREYLVCGGMPAVVTALANEGIVAAREVQEGILTSYLDDLAKYARRHPLVRLQRIFKALPGVLGTRVKYVNLSRDDQHRDIKDVLELLTMAGIVAPVTHSDCSGIPLGAGEDHSAFKLLFLDVGLACRALGLDWDSELALDEIRLINEGPLAEQFVGQELLAAASSREAARLHYWRRDESKSHAEVDYVAAAGRSIFPIEVKAGSSGTLRSLHQFMAAKNLNTAIRLDANIPSRFTVKHSIVTPDGQKDITYELISLPLYLSSEVARLMKRALS